MARSYCGIEREYNTSYNEGKFKEEYIMDNISTFLAEESTIVFTDGYQAKGADEVSEVIMSSCRAYNDGYKNWEKQQLAIGACYGLGIVFAGMGIKYLIKQIKKSKKIKIQKEEA